MGGFPPIDGPYREMLAVTRASHHAATARRAPSTTTTAPGAFTAPTDLIDPDNPVEPGDWDNAPGVTDERITRQFVTLYESLDGFDDANISLPRIATLAFAGANDHIEYSEKWGGVDVKMGAPLVARGEELAANGWTVHVLPGLDHLGAMHSDVVLPVIVPWLREASERPHR
jgi:hypothetical protein